MPLASSSLRFFSVRNSLCFLSLREVIFADKRPFSVSLSVASPAMDSSSSCALVLCGKSTVESETCKIYKEQ
ncbi:hypothetical protein SLA2020_429350 [Shorea laevis]